MKNEARWRPSKYAMRDGRLVPSADPRELAPSSRLIARLLAGRYQAALALHARGRLLDLGCGKVPLYEAYRERAASVTCVDWPGSAHGSEHVDVACDLSGPLPFRDAEFDTVLSSDVIEHLPDPALALREMGRVLRPGGALVLNTPFLYMLHEVPHDYFRLTRHALERFCGQAGLRVATLEEIGGLVEVMADLAGKGVAALPRIGSALAAGVQAAGLLAGRTALGRRLRESTAASFPLGYFLVAVKAEAQVSSSAAVTS